MSKDFDIGKGKPPKETRFKKGVSGNPKGRPKRQSNESIYEMFWGLLSEEVPLIENGRKLKLPRIKVLLKQCLQRAMKGDGKAYDQIMKMLDKRFIKEPDVVGQTIIIRPISVPAYGSEEAYEKALEEEQEKVNAQPIKDAC